jgi:predicted MFS family arabinose efflux permease
MALAVAARAPYAMIPLGTMTAFTVSSGSVATGGLAAGFVAVTSAVAGPLIGRAADRLGPRPVLLTLTPLNAVLLALLLVAALQGWTGPALWAVCIGTGATAIPVGSFARVRWVALARDPRDLATALSYESTIDEMSFVLGPALVGIAASSAFPAAPLALAAVLVALAGIPFAATTRRDAPPAEPARTITGEIPAIGAVASEAPLSSTDRPAERQGSTSAPPEQVAHPPIPRVLLAVLPAIIVMTCIGVFFGSVQAGTTERAVLAGAAGSAGLVYAVMGIGSAIMALLVVMLPATFTTAARILVGGLGMLVFIAVAAPLSSLSLLTVLLLGAGVFIGPTLVTAFTLAQQRTPPGGTGVAMTSMQSSVTVGQAAGSSVGGALAAGIGPAGAFALAALVSLIVASVGAAALRRRARRAVDSGSARSS